MNSPQFEASIDLGAIASNTAVLQECAGDAAVMVVVKADGYGHGAVPVARAALAAGAAELGVATVAEAVQLRDAGVTAPILCWLHAPETDFAPALQRNISVAVASPRHLAGLLSAARTSGIQAKVAVKVDSGLNRNGVSPDDWPALRDDLARAVADEAVVVTSFFTHLAHADEPDHPVIDVQVSRFRDTVSDAERHGIDPGIIHVANSAATMTRPDLRFDMVRPGIALYGLSPVPERGQMGLIPAMTVRGQVALVKKVAAGEGVSYGHVWTAPVDTTVALIPAGYADGVPRNLTGKFDVMLGGRRYPTVGRVCMDQFVVDLGAGATEVREGDSAILFGTGAQGGPMAQEWADALGTIHYEVVTGIKGRAVRTYCDPAGVGFDASA
ncbi:alanine racemase [Hoyosella rhizosphaerae]|uniref:Alanine racemase n=1 Tax=Hoyosella rhizosphaerae TaxID=1755582 RepID=A0A916U9A4_9ACTN|nr:alanine racemase [Hoyosella rhizosphaerae]MBN4926164.1 alanine racemase [Hoyosella rhizosphaerae]GGC65032.1 alanine racemase [Hoyosella rhizosphaerae]